VRLDDIPAGERRCVLERRGAGLLVSWLRLQSNGDCMSEFAARATEADIDRAYLGCGDVWLHYGGEYDHRLPVRMERLLTLVTPAGSPSALLQVEYEASAVRRLVPGPLVPRSPEPLLVRWRGAAAEWIRASEVLDGWKNHGGEWHPWHHPALAVRHAMTVIRQLARGLPTPDRLRLALPYLIRLVQGDREEAWRLPATATLLRMPTADRTNLVGLVRRFLLARGGTSGDREPRTHPGVAPALNAGITGLRLEPVDADEAHTGDIHAPSSLDRAQLAGGGGRAF